MPDWERKYMVRWKMPNDDYILRSDALKAILGVSIYDTIEELEGARTIAENTWADGLWDAYKIIEEEVDAADVEPVRHGLWIPIHELRPDGYPLSVPTCFWCDQCKYSSESPRKFCPNCGAKMDREDAPWVCVKAEPFPPQKEEPDET